MSPPSRNTDKINRLLRAQLDSGEEVLASGTGAEPRRPSTGIDATPAGFLLVTARRLLWSPTSKPRHRASLEFDTVTSWQEGTQYHRYALLMTHEPIERFAWAPEHRVLWFEWGHTEESRQETRTILHFSRRDTEVALAIRDQLTRRNAPQGASVEFDQPTREGRNLDAVFMARRRRRSDRFRS